MRTRIIQIGFGSFISVLTGMALGGFYLLQGWLIAKVGVGNGRGPFGDIVWLVGIGVVIGWTWHVTGPLPKPLGQIRADLAHTGTSDTRWLALQFLLPAFILTSGTSLGPEATLVSTTCLVGLWLRNHEGGGTGPWRWTPQWVFRLGLGCLAFYLTCKFGGEPSVRVSLGASHWRWHDWLWLPALVIGGHLVGLLERRAMMWLRRVLVLRFTHDWALIACGGGAIFLASRLLPAVNYSGMANFHLLAGSWPAKSVGFLILAAGVKLALVTICLNTGWLGGDIFPVLFAATAQALAVVQWFPGVDAVFFVGIFAISLGGTILESPLVAGGVMSLMFLPPTLLGVGAAATLALILLERFSPVRTRLLADGLHEA